MQDLVQSQPSSKPLSYEERSELIRKIQANSADKQVQIDQITKLCRQSVTSTQTEQKAHLTDLTICYLD